MLNHSNLFAAFMLLAFGTLKLDTKQLFTESNVFNSATKFSAKTLRPILNIQAKPLTLSVAVINAQPKVLVTSGVPSEGLNSKKSIEHAFDKDSFWYKPIPKDAPLHPNSANFVAEFLRQLRTYYGGVGINTYRWSSPTYVVGPRIPTVPVAQWDCHKPSYHDKGLDEQWGAVPMPAYGQPADGTDAEMSIYQPSTDTMWEFWKARKVNGQWAACWGGRMLNVSKNIGIWERRYGAAATGLPLMAGHVTAEELRRGVIKHAISISLVNVEKATIYSWPANRSDGYNPSNAPNRIPEGLRFRLDPSVDINALQMHPIAKIVAKAAQVYGFIVSDKGGGISICLEDPKRFTSLGEPDPYPALLKGTPGYKILAGFPWEKLQFLPMDYGKP